MRKIKLRRKAHINTIAFNEEYPMRIRMPIDSSTFSQVALAFIGSRSTLIASQPEVELLDVQYLVSVRVARGAAKTLVQQHHESESNKTERAC